MADDEAPERDAPESRERGYSDPRRSEWGYVFRQIAKGRSLSRKHLARLLCRPGPGIPAWATPEERRAIYSILVDGPGGTPFREPDDFGLFGEFSGKQASALMDLFSLYHVLDVYETTEPGPVKRELPVDCLLPFPERGRDGEVVWTWTESIEVRLRYIEAHGRWVVRSPKGQAQEIVAKRYSVSPETLKDWERAFRESPS